VNYLARAEDAPRQNDSVMVVDIRMKNWMYFAIWVALCNVFIKMPSFPFFRKGKVKWFDIRSVIMTDPLCRLYFPVRYDE
jgi:hypothetical protein